jgi:hypothetical protein
MSLLHVRVEHSFLLEIVRHGVLSQKRRLEPDLSANPFTLGMGSIGWMVASSAAAELWTEVRALDLIELMDLAPGRVAYCAGNIDLEFQDRHGSSSTTEVTEETQNNNLFKRIAAALELDLSSMFSVSSVVGFSSYAGTTGTA